MAFGHDGGIVEKRADRVVRPHNRLPTLHFVPDLSFRGREAPVGIRSPFHINDGLGRHLPLPLRGKGAI